MINFIKPVAVSFAIWFVSSILVGVAACFVMDVVPHKHFSPPLAYAIWGVLGVFVGLFHFGFSQSQIKGEDGISDWDSVDQAKKFGGQIVLLTALFLACLSAIFYPLFWSSQSNLEVLFLVVPDNTATAFTNSLFSPTAKSR